MSAPRPQATMAAMTHYLDLLYPDMPEEAFLVLSCRAARGGFVSAWFRGKDAAQATRVAAQRARQADVYLGVGLRAPTCTPHKTHRGTSEDVYAIPGLWADLDHRGGVHAAPNLPTREALQAFLSGLPCRFSLLIDSTGGIHAYLLFRERWVLETAAERTAAAQLLHRFQRFMQARAAAQGWKVDSTHNLAQVLRPAGTLNHKRGTPQLVTIAHEDAVRYNPSELAEAPWLVDMAGDAAPEPSPHDSGSFAAADLERIVAGCGWLRHCRDDAATLTEPEWYGLLGIVGRCTDGKALAHTWSRAYPRYNPEETTRKLDHALTGAGPRTCRTIRVELGGDPYCRVCPHWERFASPITLGMGTARQGGAARTFRVPDPLRRALPPPEPYPVDALGSCLAAMARKLMAVVQAPDALCAQAVVGAATLAVQAHRDVALDGRTYPLSEYYLTLGESGERKTATDTPALWPHRQWEYELVTRYEEESLRFENARDAYKKSREERLRKSKDYEERKVLLEQLGPPPLAPLKPLVTTAEPTYEGLVRLLAEGQPSLGVFSNEAGRLIGGYGMNEENQLKTAAGLSELWDGQRIDRVRGGEEATALYGRRLSMHLMMQPGVAHLLLGNSLLLEQGVLSRCLVAWPETTAGQRFYKAIDLSRDPDVTRYNAVMQDLLRRALPLAAGKRNELHPPCLTLRSDAKALWIAFHDHVEAQVSPDGELAPIRSFASKAAEHVLRLAGILTLVENPEAMQIGQDAIAHALTLVQFYITEALRLFGAEATDPDLLLAEKLLAFAYKRGVVCLPDIYQYGPNRVRDAKTARRLVSILEDHGWLLRLGEGRELDGVFRREVWEVYR